MCEVLNSNLSITGRKREGWEGKEREGQGRGGKGETKEKDVLGSDLSNQRNGIPVY